MPGTTNGPKRVVIMGAAGRDFHNFNTVFRDNPAYRVVAFTAAQIPDISDRRYPASLAGDLYPDGIPIVPESDIGLLIDAEAVDDVFLSYSDMRHEDVMHMASTVLAQGANFGFLGPNATMLKASIPVISVCAVRTGVGKSALSRHILKWLINEGRKVAVVRHPMPYGDLEKQAVQRFANYQDLDEAEATVEEREEYEPYINIGASIHAGVDYARVLEQAESDADVLIWDGGNNDLPFFRPDLHIVMVDALRPGHETAYHPGEANLRMADLIVINKVDGARPANLEAILRTVQRVRPGVHVIQGDMKVTVSDPGLIFGKSVVIVGDGPTLTHGDMRSGAGVVAAKEHGAAEIVSARPYAVGSLAEVFEQFAHLDQEIPAMGYSEGQLNELGESIRRTPGDVVLDATPVKLNRLIRLDRPVVDIDYEFQERGNALPVILEDFAERFLDV